MPITSAKHEQSGAIKLLLKYEPYFRNSISLLGKAKKGLDPRAVFEFVHLSHLSQDMVESVLSKSMKTFQNYQGNKTLLDAPTSEKLLKLFALYAKGAEVFGSVETFSEWLSRPAYGIGNQVPQDIMDTMTGLELINEELVRISYGDLA